MWWNLNCIKVAAITLLKFYLKCLNKKVNKLTYLLIRYTQLKMTLFIFSIIGLVNKKGHKYLVSVVILSRRKKQIKLPKMLTELHYFNCSETIIKSFEILFWKVQYLVKLQTFNILDPKLLCRRHITTLKNYCSGYFIFYCKLKSKWVILGE